MSATSSSGASWSGRLDPPRPHEHIFQRPDDPRLGEILVPWRGDLTLLTPGRAVLVGFPQDEGVRRNGGRPGAAQGPQEIRRWLHLLTLWDGITNSDLRAMPPLDAGNVRLQGTLEATQESLGEVVAGILAANAVPVVLGGGHETAYGHYLGYVRYGKPLAVINLDAHLDVRPVREGLGNSGTPFRQMLEHPTFPLLGAHYVCLGLQPQATAREHWEYARSKGCVLVWRDECSGSLELRFSQELDRLERSRCQTYVSVDADVVDACAVPGVSAPNVNGLSSAELLACARSAGKRKNVSSFEIVEVSPPHDTEHRSARWAALLVWYFLVGLQERIRS